VGEAGVTEGYVEEKRVVDVCEREDIT